MTPTPATPLAAPAQDRSPSHRVTFLPDGRTVTAAPGDTILDAALRAGIEIEHAFGGCCACSTCHVVIADGGLSLEDPNEREEDMLDLAPGLTSRSRLACCTVVDGDLVVDIPARNRNLVSEGPGNMNVHHTNLDDRVVPMTTNATLTANDGVARAVAERAQQLGLTYTNEIGERAIAVALPRRAEPDSAVRQRADIARLVLSGLVKVGGAALRGELGAAMRAALLHGLSPLEQRVLTSTRSGPLRIVTARADILLDALRHPHVVEMNTTIPAMQGYSDIALRAWLEAHIAETMNVSADESRRVAARVLASEGTNADDLLDALVSAYGLDGGSLDRPSIALVHRAGDSQLGELSYLASQFRARGHRAETVAVDELSFGPDHRLRAGDFQPDIVYRHIFARRLLERSPLAEALANPTRHHVYNPVTAHLEQKATLAALSESAADDVMSERLGLAESERAAVAQYVPWTRLLLPALVPMLAASPERFVIKRSWDYGGKSVLLGEAEDRSWNERIALAAAEGSWIVQERIALDAAPHLVAVDGSVIERTVFVDASAYTTYGTGVQASKGVRRASTSPIVNIQSGGIMPMVTSSLLARVAALQNAVCKVADRHASAVSEGTTAHNKE